MTKNQIRKDEFEAWAINKEIEYAAETDNDGNRLRFLAFVDGGGYKVTHGNKTLYEGGSFSGAASAYNSAI